MDVDDIEAFKGDVSWTAQIYIYIIDYSNLRKHSFLAQYPSVLCVYVDCYDTARKPTYSKYLVLPAIMLAKSVCCFIMERFSVFGIS